MWELTYVQFSYSDPSRDFDRSRVKGVVARLYELRDRVTMTALEMWICGQEEYNISITKFWLFVLASLWLKIHGLEGELQILTKCKFMNVSTGKKTSPKPLTFPLCQTLPMWTHTCLALWWSSNITSVGFLYCKIVKIATSETKTQKKTKEKNNTLWSNEVPNTCRHWH